MSIAPKTQSRYLIPIRPQLVDSLGRLRRTIRTYVLVEGLAMLVSVACAWFWLTFLFDWGLLFRTFGVDYLRDGSATIIGIFQGVFTASLIIGAGYVLVMKLLYRLFAGFDEAALALVLERKFPDVLGDRLATAVELTDPRQSNEAGYSSYMIEETSEEAAERLSGLPVNQVFNWGRLTRWCLLAAGLLASLAALATLRTDAAAIGIERNLLLRDIYWPRQTMFELVDFPDSGVKAVPMGAEMKLTVRTWKWVRNTSATSEGWRPLQWDDFGFEPSRRSHVPWELSPMATSAGAPELFAVLPETWKKLPLDEVELRSQAGKPGSATAAETAAIRQELGSSVIAWAKAIPKPESLPHSFLPEQWRQLKPDSLREHLLASEKLSPAIVDRLLRELRVRPTLPGDSAQWFIQGWSHVKPLVISNAAVLQLFDKLRPRSPINGLTKADLELLPSAWRMLKAKDLAVRLEQFTRAETPAQIGGLVVKQLETFFEELESRGATVQIMRRTEFRRLDVPEEITVEFEQILTAEERGRSKPRIGQPKIRRIPDTADFTYDFKKLERTVRFRVMAGDNVSHWQRIEVVPLPALRRLHRYQQEPGYLHSSNAPVQMGPYSISLEGDESRFDVPAGTVIRLDGECDKPLRALKVFDQAQTDSATATPVGTVKLEGEHGFEVTFPPAEREELKLRMEFVDSDGIIGVRKLAVGVVADRPPEFVHANFEVVRREMISPDAVIPFNGKIQDEHGLMAMAYDVRIMTPDNAVVYARRIPFRLFRPLRFSPPRFDSMKELSISRLNAGSRWIHGWRQLSLGRMPLAGPLALYDMPPMEVPREHTFDFPYRPPEQPVFSPAEDEYLDSQLIRNLFEREKPKEAKLPAPPYRLSIQLVARDNYIAKSAAGRPPVGQEQPGPETFEFQVIDTADLVIKAQEREEDLSEKFEAIIANLKKAQKSLQRMSDDFENVKTAEDVRRTAADCEDIARIVRENRDTTEREVSREFRMVYRELVLNRCRSEDLERVDRICQPLEAVIRQGQEFHRAEDALTALAARFGTEGAKTPAAAFRPSLEALDQLIRRLVVIMTDMKKLLQFNQLVAILRQQIKQLDELNRKNEERRKKETDKELGGDEKP